MEQEGELLQVIKDKEKRDGVSRALGQYPDESHFQDHWKNLSSDKTIQILHLYNGEITNGMFDIISKDLGSIYPNIQIMDLRCNFLTEFCADSLSSLIKVTPRLKFLILLRNPMSYGSLYTRFKQRNELSDDLLSKVIWLDWSELVDETEANSVYGKQVVSTHIDFYKLYAPHLNFAESELFPKII